MGSEIGGSLDAAIGRGLLQIGAPPLAQMAPTLLPVPSLALSGALLASGARKSGAATSRCRYSDAAASAVLLQLAQDR